MSFNLATILRESANSTPEKPLLHLGEISLTYGQVDELSGRVASSLLALGLEPGDRVAVQLPNLPQFVFTYFAALKAGLVLVPLNPLLRLPEVEYHLRDSGAKVLVTFAPMGAEAAQAAAKVGDVRTYAVTLPGDDTRPDGTLAFDELYLGEDTRDIAPLSPDETAVLLYTSGTTGRPKGAELTHFQLFMAATTGGNLFGYQQDDVALAVLPLFHVFGLSSVLSTAVRFGGTIVLVPRFELEPVLTAMQDRRCTVFLGVPTMYVALLQADTSAYDLSALRVGISGGAAIPGEIIRAFEEKFPGVVVLEGYGLSETSAIATFNESAEHRRVLSIGRPMWGVEVRIVDGDDGELPRGEEHIGEIVIRGHNVMKGYWGKPEATAEAMRGGWFHTGDLGYRDADGYFFIVDRKKDMIIRGGFNVYPREIEEVLFAHPAVAEAAVIGKPDDRLGEEVVAVISLKPGAEATAEEVIAFTKEQLAAYKYPREVRIVAELPKGPTGKILKTELRD
ncbi:long-chain fatty acid--CoA ligase [Aquihabitans sp. G128]|uniref:long-chain-fatty-acid--CoA ligase n=1 Tax=Aquihabitans sp. G128 TaxID=2849779 RepID=UPI001C2369EC|nr:long-chain fatty acid--CoA ligase [Aquihabitans sp. G128]QXC62463.1 long-chain fatty acid--CoA ligase [Aquihabitans sp. G128]